MPLLETDFLLFIIMLEGFLIYILMLKLLIEKKKKKELEERVEDAENVVKDVLIAQRFKK